MKNNNLMGKYLFKDTDLLCGLYASSTILLVRIWGYFHCQTGWQRRLRVDTCKKAWFLQKIVFG